MAGSNVNRAKEIPTIDCQLVTITVPGANVGDDPVVIGLNTASKIQVDIQTETQDAVKLIIKGVLKAQKKKQVTVTGNQIILTDNVFTPEVVKILQGGTITYDQETGEVTGYTPPVVGAENTPTVFTLRAYSAIYNAAGVCTAYEVCAYPNCTGNPISMTSEDNVFRVPEYTIDSAPNTGEAPYSITYIGPNDLPVLVDPDEPVFYTVTQTLTHVASSFSGDKTEAGSAFTATLTESVGHTMDSVTVTMGSDDVTTTAYDDDTGVISIAEVTGNITITATATADV